MQQHSDTVSGNRRELQFELWLIVLLLLIAYALRVFNLEQNSLWTDEIAQALIVKPTLWQTILNSAQHTGSTPLDYIITHITIHYLGQSEVLLRLPDVIWGSLSVPLIYCVGRSLFNRPTGYLAAALLTFMPLHIQYSREMRFYILPTFLILLSIYTLTLAIKKNTWHWWVLYGLVLVLGLYSNFYTAIAIGIEALWVLLFKRQTWSVLVSFVVAAGCAGLLFAPWTVYFISGSTHLKFSWFNYPTTLEILSAPFLDYTVGGIAILAANAGTDALRDTYFVYIRIILSIVTLYGSILGLGVYMVLRRQGPRVFAPNLSLLLLLTVGGVVCSLGVSYITGYFFAARQVLFFTPAILLAISASYIYFVRLVRRKVVKPGRSDFFLANGAVVLLALSLILLWRPLSDLYTPYKQDWRAASKYLAQNVGKQDILLSPQSDLLAFYAPELLLQMPKVLPEDQVALAELARTHAHIWFLLVKSELYPKPPALVQWIQDKHLVEIPLTLGFALYRYTTEGLDGISPK